MKTETDNQIISKLEMAMKTNQRRSFLDHAKRMGRAALAMLAVIAGCFGLMRTALADTLLFEGFEGSFPADNGWTVGDANASGTNAWWKDVNSSFGTAGAHGGSWKGYCAGYGYLGTTTSPLYQPSMDASMRRALNLSNGCSPVLSFWYRTPGIETCCDHLVVSVGGSVIFSNASATVAWSNATVNLSPWVGTQPTLDFTFHSDSSGQYEGVYLDDIQVTATPPTAILYSAWWGTQQDADGDGCLTAPNDTFRLNWDPDVSCSSSTPLSVFEKIYRRTCGSSTYTLYHTTSPHAITGASAADQQYLDIPASGGCTCYDYMMEIYRAGQTVADSTMDSSNNGALGNHREELLAQDWPTVKIYNAWWGNQQDTDGDGCWTAPNDTFRLYWDADVTNCAATMQVYEKVYSRPGGSGSWTLYTTTAGHWITNCSSTDTMYVDLPAHSGCAVYDYKIELYRLNHSAPDFVADASMFSLLGNHKEEFQSEEKATLFSAYWAYQQDDDGDGCWASTNNTFRLRWDPDVVNCNGTLTVFEKVYYQPCGGTDWTLFTITANHVITGCAIDSIYVDIPAASGCACYNYKIELYRAGQTAPDYILSPTNNAAVLASHQEELYAQDECLATISDAWWAYQQDHDGDSCWASTNDVFRLTWDPDVVNCSGSLTVFEKLYLRPNGTTTWSLWTTTAPHTITGTSTADQQYADFPAGTGCKSWDYKIEIYRSGQTAPDYARDPSNDADLSNHHEELHANDECLATIFDAWWAYQQDHDGDGCWASTNDVFRLTWDPDVVNCSGSLTVFEKVYLRTNGTTPWILWTTTAPHTITGTSTADQQYVNLPAGPGCNSWDYKIEIYRSGRTVPDYIRDPSNDADLANHREELYAQDECLATIFDAWWAYQQDQDGDGCWASTNNVFRLTWDPDVVNCNGALSVFEKVYLRTCGTTNWTLWRTNPMHTITGTSTADQQYVDIPAGTGCTCYDYKIEVFRSGQTVPDYSRDPSNDSDLASHREEGFSQDDCSLSTATISDAWWSYQTDNDGNGCWEPLGSNQMFQLNWDPDVVGCHGSLTVFEKVYYRSCGTTSWTVFTTTPQHIITGASTADQQYVTLPTGLGCSCWDYKIEIYRGGQASPDYTRDPSNDADLGNHREEALNQPRLSIMQVSSNVVVSWSTNFAGFTLESVASLPEALPIPWAPAGPTPVIVGDQFAVTNSIGTSNKFYRLIK